MAAAAPGVHGARAAGRAGGVVVFRLNAPWTRWPHAAHVRLLAPSLGPLPSPIRAPLLGAEGFALLGHALAQAHGVPSDGADAVPFVPRLRDNLAMLGEAQRVIARQQALGRPLSPAGEWLHDNMQDVIAQTQAVRDDGPWHDYRHLPMLADAHGVGLPRIYAIAWHYLSHTDSAFDPELLVALLCAYQSEHVLTQAELWALPTTLRLVLVENLRRLAERVATQEAAREAAHALCDTSALRHPLCSPSALQFSQLRVRGVADAFALQVMQRLHADSETGTAWGAAGRETLRAALAEALPDPSAALEAQQAEAAADTLSVSRAIVALGQLMRADWRGWIAKCSVLMQQLLAWPPFAEEHPDTQDASLHEIERLARRGRCSEQAVAGHVLALARHDDGLVACRVTASLGYWLLGPGRVRLGAELRVPSHPLGVRRTTLPLLLTGLGTLTAAVVWGFMQVAALPGLSVAGWILLSLLAALPASEVAVAVVFRVVSESIRPCRLPRLALPHGIPAEHRVLVVMPVLLDSAATLDELALRLERHHLANPESHTQFALLSDFVDAAAAVLPTDAALLQRALARLDALNARYPVPTGTPLRFLLLHRPRRWSDSEGTWMGWERKRGKLEALTVLLAGGPNAFLDFGARSQPASGTPYVLTLDSDTVLPPGALRELVAVAAHPMNRPRVSSCTSGPARVLGGYGILQPRLQAAWPPVGGGSLFHRMFAGGCAGHEAYHAVASDVYQDLFGEGSFSGKGLLHVQAFQAVLVGHLPEGQILSHDLLEGCMARCGSVGDVSLLEPAPQHADVASARLHRWTRGDWQLLPLLWHARRHGLTPLHCWKLLDNLRRSLVAPAALLLLLLALSGVALSPWAALALGMASLAAAPLLGAIAGMSASRDDVAMAHFARESVTELGRVLMGLLWQVSMWLRQSVLAVDAIVRALWRSGISHRGLLSWTTAAAVEGRATLGVQAQFGAKMWGVAVALMLGAGLWALRTPTPRLAGSMCLLWALTPGWIAWVSRPAARVPTPLREWEQAYLQGIARDTWDWFAAHVGPDSHHLPPDNVQMLPRMMVAQRTSPTNIGLYLLAAACARAFGWITALEFLQRVHATVDTLERLPKERGHVLNWIDTATLQPLLPAYVSTVDSGNLCGHLLTVAQACEAVDAAAALQQELDALAVRCRRLAEATEFGFLFDPQRCLLHIGWQVADQKLDPGHYDLLASESRLASLWAIAKGDVPAAHWAALGRPFQARGLHVGLKSWAGSMFEYLMPALVLDEPSHSVLGCAARAAVHEQRCHARDLALPWGVSESAYAVTDRTLAYQYAPQGVPNLAQRHAPADEHVVAPYATALAALCEPREAVRNLLRLQALQMRTPWGFFESLDFTPDRQQGDEPCTRVQTYMAHHQGMTLAALAAVLLDGQPRRWCMADVRLAAVGPLLQERLPREVARQREAAPVALHGPQVSAEVPWRDVVPGDEALPRTQLLGNAGYRESAGAPGSPARPAYSVSLRANGAGWSRFGDVDIGRWRDDALRDTQGHFFFVRRAGERVPVSITQHPAPDAMAQYRARFLPDRVCFDALWPDLHARCTVWVSPEDDVELRRVELWNTSSQAIALDLMSAFEVSLSAARSDEMHPSFTNLFIRSEWDADRQALYLARRPRREDESSQHAVHFIAHAETGSPPAPRALADRALWQGRLRAQGPWLAAFDAQATPSGSLDTGLDPVAALCVGLTLAPHGTAQVTWATAAALDVATLGAHVDAYRRPGAVDRASQLSATLHALRQRERRLTGEDLAAIQALTSLLVLVHARPDPATGEQLCDRRLLWRFGLSGERPMVLVTASTIPDLALVQTLIQGVLYWAQGGVGVDLVLVNAEPQSYVMPLEQSLQQLRERHAPELQHGPASTRGALTLLRSADVTTAERTTLSQLARVRFNADGRPLARHVADLQAWHDVARSLRAGVACAVPAAPPVGSARQASPGHFGGVDGAHAFAASLARPTPRPWVNVLANASFGCLVSESGGGWSWAGNSRLHQLSAWSNDALADTAREHFALHDLRSGAVWNLAPGLGAAAVDYRVEHSPTGSRIGHTLGDLGVELSWEVDPVLSVRRVRVTLTNGGDVARRVRVLGAIEWLLGAVLADRQTVRTRRVGTDAAGRGERGVLLATQLDAHDGAGGQTAFWALQSDGADPPVGQTPDWTCDRRELFDARGHRVWPERFGRQEGVVGEPCAALAWALRLEPHVRRQVEFVLGHAPTPQAAVQLAQRCMDGVAPAQPPHRLDALHVHSPDPLFDVLVNHWLLHQVTACRMWGRAGTYQAGGAYGFRDQLQDAMALTLTAPEVLRAHLLCAAARQFVQGDVQHWWHPHSGAGVRTRCSDDLLWLVHAAHHYATTTGDWPVLDEQVPFIEGEALRPGAEDAYFVPRISTESASLFEHCARAIDVRLQVGAHGLPLMGTGDWNDGMSQLGAGGRGESVWLAWFLARVVADFAPVAEARGEVVRAARWRAALGGWQQALAGPAWDGGWYARAFFDDGSALGTQGNAECRIDLISQAWSVLSGVAPVQRQRQAMDAAAQHLFSPESGLLRLLTPPLVQQRPSAGYIQCYPPGVRENGGQYTHAAVWAAMAWAQLGQPDAAWKAWVACSPAHRAADAALGAACGLEAYWVAADLYSEPPWVGRGGWNGYTGSAGGLYRAAVGSICGLQERGDRLRFVPALPSHWPGVQLTLRRHGRTYQFSLCRSTARLHVAELQAAGAQPLQPGEWLMTTALPSGASYYIQVDLDRVLPGELMV